MLKEMLNKLSSSIIAILGNKLVEDEKESYKLFQEMRSLMFFIGTVISTSILFAINPFIDIWYEGEIKTSFLIALAFALFLFIFVVKICTTVFINAKGLFKETKKCAIVDTVVNLTLSIILAFKFKIAGVVFATFISVFIAEYILKTRVLYKVVFKKKSYCFHLENIKFFIIFILDLLLSSFLIKQFNFLNIGFWFLFFTIFTILNALLVFFIYWLMKETKFIKRIKTFRRCA